MHPGQTPIPEMGPGPFATLREAERAIEVKNANRCPCGGIDLHQVDWTGQHWNRELREWVTWQ